LKPSNINKEITVFSTSCNTWVEGFGFGFGVADGQGAASVRLNIFVIDNTPLFFPDYFFTCSFDHCLLLYCLHFQGFRAENHSTQQGRFPTSCVAHGQ